MSTEFAEDLREVFFPNSLSGRFGENIRKDIRGFRENILGLEENPNYYKALESIIALIMTNSWWRPLRTSDHEKYQNQFTFYHDKFGDEGFKNR